MSALDNFLGKRGVLIHHWDADGITSAAIIQRRTGQLPRIVPDIGNFFISDAVLATVKDEQPDFIIIADMALPDDSLLKLKDIANDVLLLDHHSGKLDSPVERINPVADSGNPDDWPSAGWVINDWLGEEQDIFSVLGAIGDKGKKMEGNPIIRSL